jgi:hypothetical protein
MGPKLRLAAMLRKREMSKRQFARQLEMQYTHVFRFFRVGYDPKLSTLARWAKVLKCRIPDLFEER